jgi:hypothetical protein
VIKTGGVERIRVDMSGNVAIGGGITASSIQNPLAWTSTTLIDLRFRALARCRWSTAASTHSTKE